MKKLQTVLFLTILIILMSVTGLHAATYTVTQLTDNNYNSEVQINDNGWVVWHGSGNLDTNDPTTDREVFVYDGSTTIQLTDNSIEDLKPKINNRGDIVWDGDGGPGSEIWLAVLTEVCDDGIDNDCDGDTDCDDSDCVGDPSCLCADLGGDTDVDGICDDGDGSGISGDNPCTGGQTENCDDNCPDILNPDQADSDGDGFGDVCDIDLTLSYLVPSLGDYGTKIKVKGLGFGSQRTGMIDDVDGYYSFISFDGPVPVPYPLLATVYPMWSNDKIKVKFKNLFLDHNGNFLQDQDEAVFTEPLLPFGDYDLTVHTKLFHDWNANGIYDEEDEVYYSESTDSEVFTFTDEPVIFNLMPNVTLPSQRGIAQMVKIKGINFGATQGSSILHIGGKSWDQNHPKIKIWEDEKIKFKVPNYVGPFPKYKDIWVTVNGKDSNKMQLEITDEITEP